MADVNSLYMDVLGNRVVEAFKKNDFDALYVKSSKEAAEYILKHVKSGDKVGFGGSATINSLGVKDKIKEMGAVMLDHGAPGLSPEEKLNIRRAQLTSDLFLCSSNAATINGELVNVDGVGNRVAAMMFGPKKVIVVIGVNKICKDLDGAFDRIEMEAAPKNNFRFETGNACTKVGSCVDCKNPKRLCRAYSILKRKPSQTDLTIVVVGENLGF